MLLPDVLPARLSLALRARLQPRTPLRFSKKTTKAFRMIDWLTLKLPLELLTPAQLQEFRNRSGRVLCIDADGQKLWEKIARETVRSDSHQLVVDLATDSFMLHGSPARVNQTHNVFGEGNPQTAALLMIDFAIKHVGIELPRDLTLWRCTRMDITQNYDLGSGAEVRAALSYLRQAEGGRYQVRTSSETVYWSSNSVHRSGKAYHKGPHVKYQMKRQQAQLTEEEINLSDNLLRLELSLKSQYWRQQSKKPWHQHTELELEQIHNDYFAQFIGKVEVVEMDNFLASLEKVAPTKGRALAAYRTWSLIKSVGPSIAKESMRRATWYEHKKYMIDAGLTWADLQAQNVVPFRRRTIELGAPVRSFYEIRRAA